MVPRFVNYDHRYHAGNPADVLKHAALALVILELIKKDEPILYVDTHAGIGTYRLDEPTGEWKQGIGRLLSRSARRRLPELGPYLDLTREEEGDAIEYPGSPAIAWSLFRPQDRLRFFEAHPRAAQELARQIPQEKQAQVVVEAADGYAALLRQKPKDERLVTLIDPPFEKDDEWDRIDETLLKVAGRSQGAMAMLWYPLKAGPPHEGRADALRARLERAKARGLSIELRPRGGLLMPRTDAPRVRAGLSGTGLLFVEAPSRAIARLTSSLPELARSLARPTDGFGFEITIQGWG